MTGPLSKERGSTKRPPRRGNQRIRRLVAAIVATLAGTALLAAAGVWLDRLNDTDLADPSAGVTARFDHVQPAEAPKVEFHDVAADWGVDGVHGPGPRRRLLPEDTGSGACLADFDGDEDLDLFLPNFGVGPEGGANLYYRNDGGHFTEVAAAAGVDDPQGFAMGATAVDFDADGDLDLYVTQDGPNRLFRNRGDGRFEDVAQRLGVAGDVWSVGAAWGDFDRDGRLDLYVANYVRFEAQLSDEGAAETVTDPDWQGVPFTLNPNAFDPVPNHLYRQLADGTFEEIAVLVGASDPAGRSLSVTTVDLDGDGWLDLYIANDVSPNVLLHNVGDPEGLLFEDWSARTGTADPRGSMGISVADLGAPAEDGGLLPPDGLPDLFVSHWVAQENALYQATRNDSAGPSWLEYRDRVRPLRLAEISTDRVGWGTALVDFDLDGRLDIVVANGSTLEEADDSGRPRLIAQRSFLFWNDGARFHDLASVAGTAIGQNHVARGLAVGDLDRDGDPDLVMTVNRGYPLVLRNDQQLAHHWLVVELGGLPARRHGAMVELLAADGTRQIRWWGADVSFASQHAPELLFGLGDAVDSVDVTVHWIGGPSSHHPGLAVDVRHRLEPDEL
ncbi:MAG: CRTAC1 family protein [Thermoanaerobaculia bacterium]|nr:CRTAC1 family protein [Thermoanaerobaculia bacterium]